MIRNYPQPNTPEKGKHIGNHRKEQKHKISMWSRILDDTFSQVREDFHTSDILEQGPPCRFVFSTGSLSFRRPGGVPEVGRRQRDVGKFT